MEILVKTKDISDCVSRIAAMGGRTTDMHLSARHLQESADTDTYVAGEAIGTIYGDRGSLQWSVPVELKKEGELTIDARSLEKFLKVSSRSDISLLLRTDADGDGGKLRIETATGAHDFALTDNPIYTGVKVHKEETDLGNLSEVADALTFASKAKEANGAATSGRAALSGVNITRLQDGRIMRVAGTDGQRLNYVDLSIQDSDTIDIEDIEGGLTIPGEIVGKIADILKSENAYLRLRDQMVTLLTRQGRIDARLMDAPYPNYTPLTELRPRKSVILSTERFATALQRSSVNLSADPSNAVKLIADSNGVGVASSATGRSSTDTISEDGSQEFHVAFNHQYMLQAIEGMKTSQIRLGHQSENEPILIDAPDRPNLKAIIMPVRAGW